MKKYGEACSGSGDAERKKLGEAVSGSALAARRLDLIKCEHEPFLLAAECMATLVGSHNEEHYFVATQDLELQKKFRQVYGGALIHAKNTSLVLEHPCDTQKQYAKMGELERNRVSELEKRLLSLRQKKKEEEDVKGSDGLALPVEQKNNIKNQNPLGVADRPVFKRKRAKGPNPLSCKKKKTKIKGEQKSTEQVSQKQNSAATEAGVESQEKKKKKKKKKKNRRERKKSSQNKGPEEIGTSMAS